MYLLVFLKTDKKQVIIGTLHALIGHVHVLTVCIFNNISNLYIIVLNKAI